MTKFRNQGKIGNDIYSKEKKLETKHNSQIDTINKGSMGYRSKKYRGSPPIMRKNLLLPNLDVEQSDQKATNGSAIASIILPKSIAAPNTVITPKNLSLETKGTMPSATLSLGGSRKAIAKVNQIESNNTHPVVDRLYRKNLFPLIFSKSFSFPENPNTSNSFS